MKKDEFFNLLNRRLSVIEEDERRDILDEYRQHIALKMKDSNVSEEEALADFGDVDSLADEILSAYHVNIDANISEKISKKEHPLLTKITACIASAWKKVKAFCSRSGRNIAEFFSGLRTSFRALIHRNKKIKLSFQKQNI